MLYTELSFLYVFFSLAFFLFCIKLIVSKRSSKTIPTLQLPPGSTGLPIVGETLEFSTMGRRGVPEKFLLERMNKHSHQVFKTSLLGEKTAVCCGVSGNKFLFSNQNELIAFSWPSSAKKIFPHSGTTTKTINDNAMRFRGIFFGFFKPDALRNCVEMVDVVAKEHLKNHWDNQKEVNALSMVKQFAFTAACRLFLNLDNHNKIKDLAKPFEVLVSGIFSLPINLPGTSYHRGIKAANAIRKKLIEIIREKKNDMLLNEKSVAHDQDYLSHLLTVTDDNGKLSTELEVADQILASLAGSRDSTTSAITFIMKYLAEFPDIYYEVLKEQRSIAEAKSSGELLNWKDLQKMKYAWNVASEVLRLQPPVQGNFREALTDFNYSNFFIPKKWKLHPCRKETISLEQTTMKPNFFQIALVLVLVFLISSHSRAINADGEVGGRQKTNSPPPASSSGTPSGGTGSAHGSNWDANWGWGSSPGGRWGYGSASSRSPDGGGGSGFSFGWGGASGSGSGNVFGSGGGSGAASGYGASNGGASYWPDVFKVFDGGDADSDPTIYA